MKEFMLTDNRQSRVALLTHSYCLLQMRDLTAIGMSDQLLIFIIIV